MIHQGTVVWQLGRIHQAYATYSKNGVRRARRPFDSWWEPGSIWAVTDPSDALEFSAFQIGVTLREIGGLGVVDEIIGLFRDEHGPDATGWLANIWGELQPDCDARQQFVLRFGGRSA
ncbi:hypothetical protein EBBID32_45480 [Sphingobium indicum BiD32]|uniref:Uncharacterized protein n=1 Tax=Sphingobium indicum BiD32 TaxID=1301087 RepID=N1MXE4_9SPHN|nr:hypothetical protein [Sphingobium indicum]CCW20177.1 hypothetical protein EBBID32_45480 [Sphingobium indicum BiD32]